MYKEDILEKSRKEKNDEGQQFAEGKGRRIGVVAMSVMSVILMVYNLLMGLNNDAIFALFWTYLGFESYGKYQFTKGKVELTGAIAGIFAGVIFMINYLISTFG